MMANTYPVAQESYSKTNLQLKSVVTVTRTLMRKTDTIRSLLTVMIHSYLSTHGAQLQNNAPSFVNEKKNNQQSVFT